MSKTIRMTPVARRCRACPKILRSTFTRRVGLCTDCLSLLPVATRRLLGRASDDWSSLSDQILKAVLKRRAREC